MVGDGVDTLLVGFTVGDGPGAAAAVVGVLVGDGIGAATGDSIGAAVGGCVILLVGFGVVSDVGVFVGDGKNTGVGNLVGGGFAAGAACCALGFNVGLDAPTGLVVAGLIVVGEAIGGDGDDGGTIGALGSPPLVGLDAVVGVGSTTGFEGA